jgi:Tol biopolymer transport system component
MGSAYGIVATMRAVSKATLAAACLFACVGDNNVTTDGGADATNDVVQVVEAGADSGKDVVVEAGPACNLQADFGTPVHIVELSSTADDGSMRLSPDELTAWFFSDRLDDGGAGIWSDGRLFVATRPSLQSAWSAPVPVQMTNASIAGPPASPTITADGLTMAFEGYVGGVGQADIYVSTRPNTSAVWGAPGLAATINSNTSNELTSFWVPNGAKLYFGSDRAKANYYDLYVATYGSTGFGTPTPITELNTSASTDFFPVVSADELTIYWASTRTDYGGAGDEDIYVATRTSTSNAFSGIKRLTSVSSTDRDGPTWVSPDGCRLYVSSIRTGSLGGRDLYVASRP